MLIENYFIDRHGNRDKKGEGGGGVAQSLNF